MTPMKNIAAGLATAGMASLGFLGASHAAYTFDEFQGLSYKYTTASPPFPFSIVFVICMRRSIAELSYIGITSFVEFVGCFDLYMSSSVTEKGSQNHL